jgi:hypothetical protein
MRNDMTKYRTKTLLFGGGGAGINIDLNRNRLFAEIIYDQSFNAMLKKGANRYDEENLWTEGWIDSDFRLSRVVIKVGFVKSFYMVRKHKQNKN